MSEISGRALKAAWQVRQDQPDQPIQDVQNVAKLIQQAMDDWAVDMQYEQKDLIQQYDAASLMCQELRSQLNNVTTQLAEKEVIIKHMGHVFETKLEEARKYGEVIANLTEEVDRLTKKADSQRIHINTLVLKNNQQLEENLEQGKLIAKNKETIAGHPIMMDAAVKALRQEVARWKDIFKSEACRKNVEIDRLTSSYTFSVVDSDIDVLTHAMTKFRTIVHGLVSNPNYSAGQAMADLSSILKPLGTEISNLKQRIGTIKELNLADWSTRYDGILGPPPPTDHLMELVQSLHKAHVTMVGDSLLMVDAYKKLKASHDQLLESDKATTAKSFREAGPQ